MTGRGGLLRRLRSFFKDRPGRAVHLGAGRFETLPIDDMKAAFKELVMRQGAARQTPRSAFEGPLRIGPEPRSER